MLKRIIKRDGRVEDFIPHKVNSWAKWGTFGLGDRVDWSHIVLQSISQLGEETTSQDFQSKLIDVCLLEKNWPYNLMAGRLYSVLIRKHIYPESIPTIKHLHAKLAEVGLMRKLNYTDDEYLLAESFIDHSRDFNLAHFQVHQIRKKYSLINSSTGQEYETPQFVFMRMAMALAEDEPNDVKMDHVKNWYDHFSFNRINAPTPNYTNLGTPHNGLASCCLIKVDDNARSLSVGDHIAYTMTYMSSGIGINIDTRSLGDGIRAGKITHQGKLPYYAATGKAVKANLQGGRGGACTVYFSCYDPEVMTIIMLQNPKTPLNKQNRDIHFAFMFNRHIVVKAAKNEDVFLFNTFTAPDLTEAFYSSDSELFENLYNKYENDETFKKTYVSARSILLAAGQQGFDVATLYLIQIDEINRHTQFKDKIYSSNLCVEVTQPTQAYSDMRKLYSDEDHGEGEVSLCNLGAIVEPNIKSDEEYASAMYYCLKMIDKCIHITHYELPHIGVTAKARLNAGVGLSGVAFSMAKRGLKYGTPEGRKKLHQISERHAYFAISQSLRLGKELGNAPWINKTMWVDGWLPIDTYKRAVDDLVAPEYRYDWESLRKEIIANGGIRNSGLIAHMPVESSSKASGGPNSVYPVRDLFMKKSDAHNIIDWCATDDDIYSDQYQSAWEIDPVELLKDYSVIQKFTDQAISSDLYKDRSVNINIETKEILDIFFTMVKYGNKTRYYQNSKTSNQAKDENILQPIIGDDASNYSEEDESGCGGACKM